jgi:hypothetical protein
MAYTAIDDPSAHFHIQLWTGDDNADRLITNDANAGDFRPDLLILKNRSSVSSHGTFDSSRLVSGESTVILRTNGDGAEEGKADRFGGFETDGFTVTGNDVDTNASGDLFVAWQWKANGGSLTTNDASATSVGTIDSVYQANTTAGFSIVTYTGVAEADTAVAHGLGAVPSLIIVKDRDATKNWTIYHHSIGNDRSMKLNTTDAQTGSTDHWNNATPTSTVFYLGNYSHVNRTDAFIAYCFKSIQGYSKFGGYTGNGDADGAFNYTGFKPALIIIKCTSTVTDWVMYSHNIDVNPIGSDSGTLYPNLTDAASSAGGIDFLSNGFKSRSTNGYHNGDARTYIYMAFAEQPFVTSGGVPCTAR